MGRERRLTLPLGVDLAPRYVEALQQVAAGLADEFGANLVGLLLAGSAVTGRMREHSDLDLYVIIRPLRRQRRTRLVGGVELELFVNPPVRIARDLVDPQNHTTHMFATGVVLHDADGTMARLQSTARAALAAGFEPPGEMPALLHRYFPHDLLKDVLDVTPHEPAQAELLVADTVRAALAAHYAALRRRRPKPKNELRDLEEAAPKLAAALRPVLDVERPLAERVAALEAFVAAALAPLGGELGEWETPWEEVRADGTVGDVIADV